jgi:anti-sigma factor RsiW
MISDRARELLTAYVDGELTPRQRLRVERLLCQSAEARNLLSRLEEDAARLRNLSVPSLDHDLSGPIIKAIRDRRLRPGRRRAFRPVAVMFSSRAVVMAAASVLLLVSMTAFLVLSLSTPQQIAVLERGAVASLDPAPITNPPPFDHVSPSGSQPRETAPAKAVM